ncbi:hypothetical protein ACHQM5_011338 [Ranunculus cassubicifolius]
MALVKYLASIFSVALLLMLMAVTMLAQNQNQTGTCSVELSKLEVCIPFVVPAQEQMLNPTPECCSSLQQVGLACVCNTLKTIAHMPNACNLPLISCA